MAVASTVSIAAPAPKVGVATINDLPKPLPLPYDEAANADKDVAAAKARAKREHKLLAIDIGGNWCLDCRVLAGINALPEMKRFIDKHYVVVTVDSGRYFEKNTQIAARYGITGRLEGVPSLLIVNPRTDKLINAGHTAALADARHMTPQGLADWLASWAS
jgi:hypothetical protein